MFVPVVSQEQEPLMPTTPSRARRWIKSGEATPFWKKGIFCIRLNRKPSDDETQSIAVGIDPGSKKEGFTVKSASHTYLNIQADAVTWVKRRIKRRREVRRTRRNRKTPCRQPRWNRACLRKNRIPPSTKARWQWKLRILNWLHSLFPVTMVVVEDIKAQSRKGKRRWNKAFSPLQVGKSWFYNQVNELFPTSTLKVVGGRIAHRLRRRYGLKKIKNKLSNDFHAHCIDSWTLANAVVMGNWTPENKRILLITPLQLYRRQLHVFNPSKGGKRRLYGGTRSMGFKRSSIVRHTKYGTSYVGGTSKDSISLHSISNGNRLCQNAKPQDCTFLAYNSWRQ